MFLISFSCEIFDNFMPQMQNETRIVLQKDEIVTTVTC